MEMYEHENGFIKLAETMFRMCRFVYKENRYTINELCQSY